MSGKMDLSIRLVSIVGRRCKRTRVRNVAAERGVFFDGRRTRQHDDDE